MKKKIVRKRHHFLVPFANFLIVPFLRKKAGFTQKKYDVRALEPFIVVSNHVSAFDPIFLTGTFNRQVYYMASEFIFSKGLISTLLKWAFAPIPKTKGQNDVGSVKAMIQTIKEGGNVGVFIEGDSTMNGTLSNIPTGIGKLVLMLKRPLIIYNFHGGYLSNPRWSTAKRDKRKFTGQVRTVLTYDDYKHLSVDELNTLVNELITVNAYDEKEQFAYVGKHNAEGLNRFVWMCPVCKGVNTLRAKGNNFNCIACDFTSIFNEYGYLESSDFNESKNTLVLDEENKIAYQEHIILNPDYSVSESGHFIEVFRKRRHNLGDVKITLSRQGLTVFYKRKKAGSVFYPFADLDSMEMQQKKSLIIYLKHEQTKVLVIPETNIVGSYQFIITFQILKNILAHEANGEQAIDEIKNKRNGFVNEQRI